MAKNKPKNDEPTIENRKARHLYAVGETLEVGIALRGTEVKSVRAGQVSLGEGFVRATADPVRLTLHGVHIGEYPPAGSSLRQHAAERARILLAHRREILKFAAASESKGTTIVPLKMYFKNGRAKVLIGLGTGKRTYDKRQDIKKREADRDISRAMSKRL